MPLPSPDQIRETVSWVGAHAEDLQRYLAASGVALPVVVAREITVLNRTAGEHADEVLTAADELTELAYHADALTFSSRSALSGRLLKDLPLTRSFATSPFGRVTPVAVAAHDNPTSIIGVGFAVGTLADGTHPAVISGLPGPLLAVASPRVTGVARTRPGRTPLTRRRHDPSPRV